MSGSSARYSRLHVPVETGTPPWDPPKEGNTGLWPERNRKTQDFLGSGYSTPKVSTVTVFIR